MTCDHVDCGKLADWMLEVCPMPNTGVLGAPRESLVPPPAAPLVERDMVRDFVQRTSED